MGLLLLLAEPPLRLHELQVDVRPGICIACAVSLSCARAVPVPCQSSSVRAVPVAERYGSDRALRHGWRPRGVRVRVRVRVRARARARVRVRDGARARARVRDGVRVS